MWLETKIKGDGVEEDKRDHSRSNLDAGVRVDRLVNLSMVGKEAPGGYCVVLIFKPSKL